MTPLRMVSIDPGATSSGWALWDRTIIGDCDRWGLSAFGLLKSADVLDMFSLLGVLGDSWAGVHAVVEGQWYRCPACSARARGKARLSAGASVGHFRAVATLIESRVSWASALLIAGASVDVAPPGQWIQQMAAGAPGSTPDARIKWTVRQRWPGIKAVADEHTAILLGEWWLESGGHRIDRSRMPIAGMRGIPADQKGDS